MSLKLEDLDAISSITFNSDVTREIMVDALDFAVLLNDDLISSWARSELRGYSTDLGPVYRTIGPEVGEFFLSAGINESYLPREKKFVRNGILELMKEDVDPSTALLLSFVLASTFSRLRAFLVSLHFAADENSRISDSKINYVYENTILADNFSDLSSLTGSYFEKRTAKFRQELTNEFLNIFRGNENQKFPTEESFYKEFLSFGEMIDSFANAQQRNFYVVEGTLTALQTMRAELLSSNLSGPEGQKIKDFSEKILLGMRRAFVRSYPEIGPILKSRQF